MSTEIQSQMTNEVKTETLPTNNIKVELGDKPDNHITSNNEQLLNHMANAMNQPSANNTAKHESITKQESVSNNTPSSTPIPETTFDTITSPRQPVVEIPASLQNQPVPQSPKPPPTPTSTIPPKSPASNSNPTSNSIAQSTVIQQQSCMQQNRLNHSQINMSPLPIGKSLPPNNMINHPLQHGAQVSPGIVMPPNNLVLQNPLTIGVPGVNVPVMPSHSPIGQLTPGSHIIRPGPMTNNLNKPSVKFEAFQDVEKVLKELNGDASSSEEEPKKEAEKEIKQETSSTTEADNIKEIKTNIETKQSNDETKVDNKPSEDIKPKITKITKDPNGKGSYVRVKLSVSSIEKIRQLLKEKSAEFKENFGLEKMYIQEPESEKDKETSSSALTPNDVQSPATNAQNSPNKQMIPGQVVPGQPFQPGQNPQNPAQVSPYSYPQNYQMMYHQYYNQYPPGMHPGFHPGMRYPQMYPQMYNPYAVGAYPNAHLARMLSPGSAQNASNNATGNTTTKSKKKPTKAEKEKEKNAQILASQNKIHGMPGVPMNQAYGYGFPNYMYRYNQMPYNQLMAMRHQQAQLQRQQQLQQQNNSKVAQNNPTHNPQTQNGIPIQNHTSFPPGNSDDNLQQHSLNNSVNIDNKNNINNQVLNNPNGLDPYHQANNSINDTTTTNKKSKSTERKRSNAKPKNPRKRKNQTSGQTEPQQQVNHQIQLQNGNPNPNASYNHVNTQNGNYNSNDPNQCSNLSQQNPNLNYTAYQNNNNMRTEQIQLQNGHSMPNSQNNMHNNQNPNPTPTKRAKKEPKKRKSKKDQNQEVNNMPTTINSNQPTMVNGVIMQQVSHPNGSIAYQPMPGQDNLYNSQQNTNSGDMYYGVVA